MLARLAKLICLLARSFTRYRAHGKEIFIQIQPTAYRAVFPATQNADETFFINGKNDRYVSIRIRRYGVSIGFYARGRFGRKLNKILPQYGRDINFSYPKVCLGVVNTILVPNFGFLMLVKICFLDFDVNDG